ncbi:cytochrome P450 monooxygenase [Fomitopsis betulina]|nr:cytochrome P450 monooxygenase [Fomitopsis betulina]
MSATVPLLLVTIAVFLLFFSKRRQHTLLPGPKPLPFIGNVHQLPAVDQHKTFAQWGAQYGDVVFVKFFQQPVVILNSAQAALDLMEKRGAKYSGRPRFTFQRDLVEWLYASAWMSCNDVWRQQRKWFQQMLMSKSSVESYQPLQRREVNRLLLDLLQNPANFQYHLKRYAAAVILELGYGRTITSLDDDFIRIVEKGVSEALGTGSGPGSGLVDFFPIRESDATFTSSLPSWFPGAGFKKAAASARESIRAVEDIPFEQVQREMASNASGIAKDSFTKDMIEFGQTKGDLTPETLSSMKGAAGMLYVAGTDTSLTPLIMLILEMTLHPEVLKKAQDEIAIVVGDSRLPDFDDRPQLPFIECVLRELYRYCPSGALGVPHAATEDDVYRGYNIPKGATVIANIWAMMRDTEHYVDPDVFRPERFLEIDPGSDFDAWDPKKLVFGFGRRVCPGAHLADNSVWLVISRIIATLDIRKARDETGAEITPNPVLHSGTVTHPEPFLCDIRPRSEKAKQLILDGRIGDINDS